MKIHNLVFWITTLHSPEDEYQHEHEEEGRWMWAHIL
jgi:hypothetical protein